MDNHRPCVKQFALLLQESYMNPFVSDSLDFMHES